VLVTMDAEQGVEALRLVDPRQVVPVHHEDFDVFTSPLEDFLEAAGEAGLRERVRVVGRGERHLLDS
jgi:L-ascorbate metabolism protein UlaG (beta-lactamase superfamily)